MEPAHICCEFVRHIGLWPMENAYRKEDLYGNLEQTEKNIVFLWHFSCLYVCLHVDFEGGLCLEAATGERGYAKAYGDQS